MSKVWTFIGGVITGVAGVVAAAIIDEKLDERRRVCRSEEIAEVPEERAGYELP